MNGANRKAAIAAYKKQKSAAGIYAVRCAPTGQAWVGQTLNLESIQNRIWFMLGVGSHSNQELQSAWTVYGADAFIFEVLEQLKDEELPYVRDTLLKERLIHWRSTLNGLAV
jgi:hypothetical protein